MRNRPIIRVSMLALAWTVAGGIVARGQASEGAVAAPTLTRLEFVVPSVVSRHCHSLELSPDGKLLLGGFVKGAVVWHVEQPDRQGYVLAGTEQGPAVGAFRADGTMLIASGTDTGLGLITYDPATLRALHMRDGPAWGARSFQLSSDGGLLIVVGQDRSLRLWDTVASEPRGEPIATRTANAMALTPDGSRLVLADHVQLRVFDTADGREVFATQIEGRPTAFQAVAISSDGRLISAMTPDRTVRTWEVGGGLVQTRTFARQAAGRQAPFILSYHPRQAGTLLVRPSTGEVVLLEAVTGLSLAMLDPGDRPLTGLAWSTDGRLLLGHGSAEPTTAYVVVMSVPPRPELPGIPETVLALAMDGDLWWDRLGSSEASVGQITVAAMIRSPQEAVQRLGRQLRPASADEDRIAALLRSLDDDEYRVRVQADEMLRSLGATVQPQLKEALAANPSLEVRWRVEQLLQDLAGTTVQDTTSLRFIRAVQVLEWIDNHEARELLTQWSGGAPGATLTRQAQAALNRMSR